MSLQQIVGDEISLVVHVWRINRSHHRFLTSEGSTFLHANNGA